MTPADARRAVNLSILRSEVEGCWEARCPCGHVCGGSLGPPIDPEYVACPICGRRYPEVQWVWISPDTEFRP
jgi:hypothetical protein